MMAISNLFFYLQLNSESFYIQALSMGCQSFYEKSPSALKIIQLLLQESYLYYYLDAFPKGLAQDQLVKRLSLSLQRQLNRNHIDFQQYFHYKHKYIIPMGVCNSEECVKMAPRGFMILSAVQYKTKNSAMTEKELKKILFEIFDKFDTNHDQYLDLKELQELVKHVHLKNSGGKPREQEFYFQAAKKLMRTADSKDKGKISKEDFYRFYKEN